jgi:hypothetical protein
MASLCGVPRWRKALLRAAPTFASKPARGTHPSTAQLGQVTRQVLHLRRLHALLRCLLLARLLLLLCAICAKWLVLLLLLLLARLLLLHALLLLRLLAEVRRLAGLLLLLRLLRLSAVAAQAP